MSAAAEVARQYAEARALNAAHGPLGDGGVFYAGALYDLKLKKFRRYPMLSREARAAAEILSDIAVGFPDKSVILQKIKKTIALLLTKCLQPGHELIVVHGRHKIS